MRYQFVFLSALYLFFHIGPLQAANESVYYEIDASVDVQRKQISARQRVSFLNQSSRQVNDVYFHLYPNRRYSREEHAALMRYAGYFKADPYPSGFVQGEMPVHAVLREGKEQRFCIEGDDLTILKVSLSEPLDPGAKGVLEIDFSVVIPNAYGRFGWHKNIIKAAYWYPVLCAQTANGWDTALFYPFHRPFYTQAARYDVVLRIPEEFTLIASGDVVKEEIRDGLKAVFIQADLPIRAFSFAMSPDYQWMEGLYRGLVLRCYYLPGDENRARQAVDTLKRVFAFYEERFGEYPYARFSVAPVHLGYGGEQMANMIFIDTRVFKLPRILDRQFEFLIAHEAGHQWFYNLIGVNGSEDLWLEEALNSYFSLEYLEHKYGKDAEVLEFPRWFKPYTGILPELSFRRIRDYRYQTEARMGYDGPLAGPLEAYEDPSRIFSLVYGKGVRVVEALREHIGGDALSRVFRRAFEEFRFQNWTSKDFMALCEQESGRDLGSFFDQWVFSGTHCDYSVRLDGRRVIVTRKGGAVFPVELQVRFDDGTEDVVIWDGKEEAAAYDYSKNIRQATADPRQVLFDLDRTNNTWPREVRVTAVPLYIGLYDIPLFLPDDAYHVVLGPEIHNGIGVKGSFQKPYEYVFYSGTDYHLFEDLWNSRVGVLKKNVWRSPVSLGAEVKRTEDLDTGREDLTSAKVYLRKDFHVWPYGLFTVQDHAAVYVIRNQRLNADNEGLHASEDSRNLEYRRRDEAIIGMSFHRDASAPYPDPRQGYRLNINTEYGGHMLGGQQYFYRCGVDAAFYQRVTPQTGLASRIKVGLGYPDDKDLFQLGGIDGLRGYPRKSVRGASAVLGIAEYRFPLLDGINFFILDNIFGLRRVDAGVFAEAGRAWFSSYSGAEWKTDAGAGLRFHIDIGGFLEKVIIRLDAAQAINDSGERPRFWLSVNSLF